MMHVVQCGTCGTNNVAGAQVCAGCGQQLPAGDAGDAGGTQAGQPSGPPPGGAPPAPNPYAPGAYTPGPFTPPGQQPPAPPGGQYPPDPTPSGQYPPGTPPPSGPPPGPYPPDPTPSGQYPPPGQPPSGQYPPPGQPPSGQYPPGGPPPSGEVPGAYGAPQPPPKKKRNRQTPLLLLAILVVVGLVAAAVYVVTSRSSGGEEVVLEPVGMVQEDDFAGNLDVGEAAAAAFEDLTVSEEVPDARVEQVDTELAGRVVEGSEPAVYGGSRDTQVCDVAALVAFLTDPANEDKAQAWAAIPDIETSEIESYLSGLTAVRLRWDTRVTNHGFRDGEANPFQSMLQAGTAVLVDETGVPRVKCNCGNPLAEPSGLGGDGGSGALDLDDVAQNPDDAWENLDPAQAVKITGGATVEAVTLVDVDTGGLIDRPVGSDGVSKTDTGTGDVKVTLEWESDADVDLGVTEPDGSVIYFQDRGPTASGGQLDVDSNVGCENTGSVENVFWPPGEAPSGSYEVTVTGYLFTNVDGSSCGSGDYTLTIVVAGQDAVVETGSVAENEVDTFNFTVP